MKSVTLFVVGIVLGGLITAAFWARSPSQGKDTDGGEKVLYWVAPMDPSYRRDQPGKSPMGMDLVPVYETENEAGADDAGLVKISPDVVNNLGVRVAEVTRQVMQSEITTVGYVKYDEDQLVHIHPRVEGWIEKLYVKTAGDPVAAGQPLYELYSPQLVNAQEELVLAVSRNNARLVDASEERLRALQIDDAVISALKRDKRVRQRVVFYAPQSGVIDNLNIREGFYVKPGTTLMSLGTLDHVWVEAEIFARQAALVVPGAPVSISLDYLPGERWQGKVDYVYPTLDPTTRTVRVRLRFSNRDNLLKPNMFAQVSIFTEAEQATTVIPREALIRTGSQNRVVMALGEGRFKSVEVQTGRVGDKLVEVRSGLSEGDQVVVSAQFLLDSESSKRAGFIRMNHVGDRTETAESHDMSIPSAWADGVINSLDEVARLMNISRGAIAKWQRPPATMDFTMADSLDLDGFKPGDHIRFRFEIRDSIFIVTELQSLHGEPSHD
jgi:membrane fusion protein, copper/silver efflux system